MWPPCMRVWAVRSCCWWLCSDPAVAAWCAVPIVFGRPGLVLTPLVLGPYQVPVVTEPEWARRCPELAVLSAIAHGNEPDQKLVFEALLATLDALDHEHAKLYADTVLTVLPTAARDFLEALMTTTAHPYQSDFARRYFDQGEAAGEARGEAKAVLAFLDARGIEVPDDVRERIAACTDLSQLDTWVRRAATARAADDLFE